ncbi:MAG TPA: tRNA 2-thiocytidine biosynthesis TtcA family protein [Clostridia bacterium]|nr:tRNA 2-thiocytidine biosynthesis TtcA family protein [Clostridia bacterium]
MRKSEIVEKSITKKFKRSIWIPFLSGIKEYQLIKPQDKIAVCISGGKDSMLMAKCMQHLQKYSDFPFEVEYIVMDPGYNPDNRRRIEENAELLEIPIKIFESGIFEYVSKVEKSPCYLCARMRRGHLYKKAEELGCNKIALGHHFDDVIETTLMSILYSGQVRTMMPKLHSTHYEGLELIRPMYQVKEADVLAWKRYNDLQFIQCACRMTESIAADENGGGSKRQEMKALIKKFREENPEIAFNIFRSVYNVNLETIISYRQGDETHSFLDNYDR